jgi:hypothetical protein
MTETDPNQKSCVFPGVFRIWDNGQNRKTQSLQLNCSFTCFVCGENRVRILGSMVLRRMYEPKREEAVERWRNLHNKEEGYATCVTLWAHQVFPVDLSAGRRCTYDKTWIGIFAYALPESGVMIPTDSSQT